MSLPKAARDYINAYRDEALAILKDLAVIPSPPGNESKRTIDTCEEGLGNLKGWNIWKESSLTL